MIQNNVSLKDITFPVDTAPVYIKTDKSSNNFTQVKGKKAIINTNTNNPISIVSDGYKIITNREAYEYGIICLKTLFKSGNEKFFKVYNIITPMTMSFCHIDLINENIHFSLFKNDKYIPFIRITNSYNTMFKLGFRIGFCRSICKNGVIFGEDSIEFSFDHVKNSKKVIDFNIKEKEFETILNKFKINLRNLINNTFPSQYSFALFCKAIGYDTNVMNYDEKTKIRRLDDLNKLKKYFDKKHSDYSREVGNNYYALYNVITDYSSNGIEDDGNIAIRMNGRQVKAGIWLDEISEIISKDNIDYEDYLGDVWVNINTQNWQN